MVQIGTGDDLPSGGERVHCFWMLNPSSPPELEAGLGRVVGRARSELVARDDDVVGP